MCNCIKLFFRRVGVLLLAAAFFASAQGAALTQDIFQRGITAGEPLRVVGDYVFILSQGGTVDTAFSFVPELESKTCIVFAAASAALMIMLPACKERYFVTGAILGFHNATLVLPALNTSPISISQWDAEALALLLKLSNDKILKHMLERGTPFSEAFLRKAMRENLVLTGSALMYWVPWLRPVSECSHCPAWTKLVNLRKTASPAQ